MKKILAIFTILLLITGCAGNNVQENYPLDEFLQGVIDEGVDTGMVWPIEEQYYETYGIGDDVEVKQASSYGGMMLESKVVIFMEVDDPVKVRQALENYNDEFVSNQFNQGYYADIEVRQNAIVDSYGNYVYLVATENNEAVIERFKEAVTK